MKNAGRSGNKRKISRDSSSAELITILSAQVIVALMPLSTVHSWKTRFEFNEIYAWRDVADGSGTEITAASSEPHSSRQTFP